MGETTEGPTYRIPLPAQVGAHLAHETDANRHAFVATAKQVLQTEREHVRALQVERINEITGMDVAGSLTGVTDAIIAQLAARAFAKAKAPEGWFERVGVFALGSYGRGELAPYSDIDLMVLAGGRSLPDWAQAGGQELQTLLWDVGFKVGGSLRSMAELEKIIADDFVTATAVLEQRPVIAGDALCDELRELRERFRKRRGNAFLRYKVEELESRRTEAGRNIFLLEPNIKTNPGCMRDVQFLRNTAYIVQGSRNLHALREMDSIRWDDVQQLFAANDHLLGIRALLHFHHGRAQDQLHLTDQLWLADLLGYARGGRLLAVEHMMRLHYEKTLHTYQMVELTISRLRGLGHIGRRRILIKTRRRIDDDFTAIDGKVYLRDRELWRQADLGLRLMRMCRTAQVRGLRISLELQREIANHVHLLQVEAVRGDHRIARVFLEILGDLGRVRPILGDMHWAGMLGAYLPEFGRLTCHMQFNSYHQYTVDEHTLLAIGNLDAVAKGEHAGLRDLPEILRRIDRPDLLNLSLLLHDAGKFMGSGHVERGALMVGPIAERMGLDEIERDLVHFLIAEHVTLSDASRGRDIHDPAFLSEIAAAMADGQRLDLLYALTYADARAVGEGVLTGWQMEILAELRDALRHEIRYITGQGAVSRPQRIKDELHAAGFDDAAAEEFLRHMGEGYAYQVQPYEVHQHLALLGSARESGLGFFHDRREETIRVAVATADRHHLMADIAAVLTGNSFEVVEARSWVTGDGLVLHSYRLTCSLPSKLGDPATWERLGRDLRKILDGSLDPHALIQRRRMRLTTDGPADSGLNEIDVRLDQDNSQEATIIDVRVKDMVGLLYELCNLIADHGCSITYASIATFGDVARDAFYVTKDQQKLERRDAISLRNAIRELLQRLSAHHDEDASTGTGSF